MMLFYAQDRAILYKHCKGSYFAVTVLSMLKADSI